MADGKMKIAVCMKCVPADLTVGINNVTGGIDRSGANSRINQADVFALETAVKLKDSVGGTIDVYTMGPEFAELMLREALALGADEAVLICDRALAGADTYATAAVLSVAIGDDYDLILCGERTVDGETGQVPGQISGRKGYSFSSSIIKAEIADSALVCHRLDEYGEDIIRLSLPAVAGISCGMSGVHHPLRPSLKNLRRAKDADIRVLNAADIGLPAGEIGAKGSPTLVQRVMVPDWSRNCTMTQNLNKGIQMSREIIDETK